MATRRTSRLHLAGFLATSAIVTLAATAWVNASASARAVILGASHQRFVVSHKDRAVAATFRLKNQGRRDLILGRPSTSCGCLSATVRPQIVRPGGEAVVSVEARSIAASERTVQVRIPTNDPAKTEVRLSVTVATDAPVPFITIEPPSVNFSPLRPGAPDEHFFIQTRERAGNPPWLARVDATLDGLAVQGRLDEEVPLAGGNVMRSYRYAARWSQIPGPGDIAGEIRFWADRASDVPVHSLPVHASVRPPVYVSPTVLNVSYRAGEPLPEMKLWVIADDPSFPLTVEVGSPAPSYLSFEKVEKAGERNRCQLRISFRLSSASSSSTSTVLTFRTNHPDVPQIQVPLNWTSCTPPSPHSAGTHIVPGHELSRAF